jgi:hypothetical protein
MNQLAKVEKAGPGISLGKLANDARERANFRSLALTQKRLSWVARRKALEAEASGDIQNYRHYAAEARRLWRDALDHLELARRRSH